MATFDLICLVWHDQRFFYFNGNYNGQKATNVTVMIGDTSRLLRILIGITGKSETNFKGNLS